MKQSWSERRRVAKGNRFNNNGEKAQSRDCAFNRSLPTFPQDLIHKCYSHET